MSEKTISDGVQHLKQSKTAMKLRLVIGGEFAELLAEIRPLKSELNVHAIQLLVNEEGEPLKAAMVRNRFDDARKGRDGSR